LTSQHCKSFTVIVEIVGVCWQQNEQWLMQVVTLVESHFHLPHIAVEVTTVGWVICLARISTINQNYVYQNYLNHK